MSKPRVAIIIYSLYHHVYTLAESAKIGIEAAGVKPDLFQVPETLTPEILKLVKAPPKPDIPIAEPKILNNYDAFYLVFLLDLVICQLNGKDLGWNWWTMGSW